jgi:hypothetical protein
MGRQGNFLVEKAMLDGSEAEGKTIVLRSAVRLESVLFVRLIRPLGGGPSFPSGDIARPFLGIRRTTANPTANLFRAALGARTSLCCSTTGRAAFASWKT